MRTRTKKRIAAVLILPTLLLVYTSLISFSVASTVPSIDLEDFRWNSFPLRVLVDMNAWSTPDYALAVREALDAWLRSIWNYTGSFNRTSLAIIRFDFYVSDINKTNNYNTLITFCATEIISDSDTIGLTTAKWNPQTHEPISPVTINITTYSATVDHQFVRNVAMHEIGHMLGLGHASAQNAPNGPELMYYISSRNTVLFPSTLDIYGLNMLYSGKYNQAVQLPVDIPYKMLSEGTTPPPESDFTGDFSIFLLLLAALAAIFILVSIFLRDDRRKKNQQTAQEIPRPPDDTQKQADCR